MYVIQRSPDGAFVAPLGSEHSYTKALQNAHIYPTKEAAQRDLCPESETIRFVDSHDHRILLRRPSP